MKNARKIHLTNRACLCKNYFSKTQIVRYRKMPKYKIFTLSFPGKTLLKLKNTPKYHSFHPIPAASTAGPWPTVIGLLL